MAVLLDNQSKLAAVERISRNRGDRTITKTVWDLLNERITHIDLLGDPLAKNGHTPGAKRRGGKPTLQPQP